MLDNDVDVAVGELLRSGGHEAWTAGSAGLAGPSSAPDDHVTAYADDHDATVITHDAEFTRRRKRNSIGRHVRLKCEQPDAVAVLTDHLDAVVENLSAVSTCVVEVSRNGVKLFPPYWD